MIFKKDVNVNAGEKPYIEVNPKIEGKVEVKVTKDKVEVIEAAPRAIAIAAKNRKGKVMLKMLEERKIKCDTVIEADIEKDVFKTIQGIIKAEADKGNKYQVAYISVSNSDINRDPEYARLNNTTLGLSVSLFLSGHDDKEISNKAAQYKIA